MMQMKGVPFGTRRRIRVLETTRMKKSRVVVGLGIDDLQGYILVLREKEDVPEIGKEVAIVFNQGGPFGGYWDFERPAV
jgi:hypothetical protein